MPSGPKPCWVAAFKSTKSHFYFRDHLEGYRFDLVAGALQQYTEEILVEWARNCLSATRARRLCFGGGTAMNVKAMMRIAEPDQLDDIFICPAPSDESLAIGAAYAVMYHRCSETGQDALDILQPLKHPYLGPDLEHEDLKEALQRIRSDDRYQVSHGAEPHYVARLIANGKLVGRCVGRSKFGPRALGNRSILADPRDLDNVKRINEKVKSRDFWMPFAPSILAERADKYLTQSKRTPCTLHDDRLSDNI